MLDSGHFCCEPMISLKIFFIHLKKPNAYMTGGRGKVIIDSVSNNNNKKREQESSFNKKSDFYTIFTVLIFAPMLQKQWWGKNAGVWTRAVAPNCTDSHCVLLQCALANKKMLASLRNVFDKTVQMIGSIKSLLKFTLQNGTYAQSSFAAQRSRMWSRGEVPCDCWCRELN